MAYVIRPGDTLSEIAERHNISMAQLKAWNPVFWSNPKYRQGNRIWAGGRVIVEPPSNARRGTAPSVRPPVFPPPAVPNPPQPPPEPPKPTFGEMEDALKGEQRDAYQALKLMFQDYGLGSLAPKILEYVQQGYGADTISILLQRTDEYKRRFAANEARRAAGMSVLSPQEYIQTENAYRQIMRNAGLPSGFYDSQDDFTNFLSKDVSPTELKARVDVAATATVNADPFTKAALSQMGIGGSEVTAYFLDPTRAMPIIQKAAATAQIGGAALRNNLEFNQQRVENLYLQGVDAARAAEGYGAISGFLEDARNLGRIYGEDYDQATAEAEIFSQSGEAQEKRKRLASRERAQFSGATGSARAGLSIQRNV